MRCRLGRARRGEHPRRRPGLPPRPRPRADDRRGHASGVRATGADGSVVDGTESARLVRAGLRPRARSVSCGPGSGGPASVPAARGTTASCHVAHPGGAARPPRVGVGASRASARRAHRAQAHRRSSSGWACRCTSRWSRSCAQRAARPHRCRRSSVMSFDVRGAQAAARESDVALVRLLDRRRVGAAAVGCSGIGAYASAVGLHKQPRAPARGRDGVGAGPGVAVAGLRCRARRPRVDAAQREPAPAGGPAQRRPAAGARGRRRRGRPAVRPRCRRRC